MSRAFRMLSVRNAPVFCALLVVLAYSVPASAALIDFETFDGYANLPNNFPNTPSDPSNTGVPLQIEGADSPNWLAARVGPSVNGSISSDVAVQEKGYPSSLSVQGGPPPYNSTPSGRVQDNAALVLRLDLTAYPSATLTFDWRTHNAELSDEMVVAYHVGDGLGTPNNTYDWANLYGDGSTSWFEDPLNWTKVLDQGMASGPKPFRTEKAALPGGDIVYVAFWLRYQGTDADANAEFGKIDNVYITPEPATCLLLGVGLGLLSSIGIRRRV